MATHEAEELLRHLSPNWAMDVYHFHVKYGIEYIGPPRMLPWVVRLARLQRTREEIQEWEDAMINGCLADCLDANIDLMYFALGNLHLHGFTPAQINEAWRRVHQANMAKERAHPGNPGKHPSDGQFCDIVKPPGWRAADLSDLVKVCTCQPEFTIGQSPTCPLHGLSNQRPGVA